jgi:hypothetical protein
MFFSIASWNWNVETPGDCPLGYRPCHICYYTFTIYDPGFSSMIVTHGIPSLLPNKAGPRLKRRQLL